MSITYFKDTDTLLVTFNDLIVAETKDLRDDILIELDESGKLVSMTIEHASEQAKMPDFSFNQVEQVAR